MRPPRPRYVNQFLVDRPSPNPLHVNRSLVERPPVLLYLAISYRLDEGRHRNVKIEIMPKSLTKYAPKTMRSKDKPALKKPRLAKSKKPKKPRSPKPRVPQKCELCAFEAPRESILKRHKQAAHGVGVVWNFCEQPNCSKKFKTKGEYKAHLRQAHNIGVVWYYCNVEGCDHKSKTKGHLKDHLRDRHLVNVVWHECPEESKLHTCSPIFYQCTFRLTWSHFYVLHSIRSLLFY